MRSVSSSSLRKENVDFSLFLSFLYNLLAGLFRSLLFPFQSIYCSFVKLKDKTDSVSEVAAEKVVTDRELFKRWCMVWLMTYPSKEEEERRFCIFKEALARSPTDTDCNRPGYADRTPEELEELRSRASAFKAYPVYISHSQEWAKNYKAIAEQRRRCFQEDIGSW